VVGDATDRAGGRAPRDCKPVVRYLVERACIASQAFGNLPDGIVAGPCHHRSEILGEVRHHQLTVGHEQLGQFIAVELVHCHGVGRRQVAQRLLVRPGCKP
jgi:hypothetical protein